VTPVGEVARAQQRLRALAQQQREPLVQSPREIVVVAVVRVLDPLDDVAELLERCETMCVRGRRALNRSSAGRP
jgi:hypothetical protein